MKRRGAMHSKRGIFAALGLQVPGSRHGRGMWSGRKDTDGKGPLIGQDLLEDARIQARRSCKGKQLDNVVACIEVRVLNGSMLTES